MATDFERIKALLRVKPYIIASGATGRVRLGDEAAAFRAMNEGGECPSAFILNADEALKRFARLREVGESDRTFSLKDITAIIGGISYVGAWKYVKQGILTPSIQPASGSGQGGREAKFSWGDAFAAGVIGTLRQHGLRPNVLRKVQPLFCKPKKRTSQKRLTSGRT